MFTDLIGKMLRIARDIAKDPEHFLTTKYYKQGNPNGFRLELFTARKYNSIYYKLIKFKSAILKITDDWIERGCFTGMVPAKRKRDAVTNQSLTRSSRKTFCPYCEKTVVPKRLHKFDVADIVLILLTAGLWAIFLFAMYLFIRRCPVCNYNLRGFKYLPENKNSVDN